MSDYETVCLQMKILFLIGELNEKQISLKVPWIQKQIYHVIYIFPPKLLKTMVELKI